MKNDSKFVAKEDLAFFGRVNASISHELKNIMAIISETAGLMNDLMKMSAKGNPIDPETIMTCSSDIIEEIQRGFGVINRMNRFSHSIDEMFDTVDLPDLIGLTIDLAGFLSFAKRVRLDDRTGGGIRIETCPFRLHHLIYSSLVFAFQSTGPDGEIQVAVLSGKSDTACITFSGVDHTGDEGFPAESVRNVAASIGAEFRIADDTRSFEIRIQPSAGC